MKIHLEMRFILLFLFSTLLILCFGQQADRSCSKQKSSRRTVKSGLLSEQDNERIKRYDIHYCALSIQAKNTSSYIEGKAELHATCSSLDTIVLELHENFAIDSIQLNQVNTPFTRRKSTLYIPINEVKTFEVNIYYKGEAPTTSNNPLGGSGFSFSTNKNTGVSVAYTLSEPFYASEWWPAKQDLNDKIDSVDMYITIPKNCKVGSNGILVSVQEHTNDNHTFHWKHRYPIAYYLISMSIAPYIEYSFKVKPLFASDSILIQNYLYDAPNIISENKIDIEKTGDYLCYFSSLYGLYPFHKEKYGHCLATLSGGMEHQTMTTLLSFDNQLVAHELAHQWWGDHVTCSSWADIWLNEGFATYSEYLMLGKFDQEKQRTKLNGFHDKALSELIGSVYCADTMNKSRIFSRRLSYDKGAAIIHTLRYIINNDSLFFNALREFQYTYAFRSASAQDLKKTFEQVTQTNLDAFFSEWYYGEGYPTYAAQIDNEKSILSIIQESSSEKTQLFTTPLEIQFSRYNLSDTIIRFQIQQQEETITLSNSLHLKDIIAIDPNNYIMNQVKLYPSPIDTLETNILIYPNPTCDNLHIIQKNGGNYKVHLIDITGKEIINKEFTKEITIDVSILEEGNYTVEILNGETKNSFKKQVNVTHKR